MPLDPVRSKEEASKRGKNGGVASGVARRRKRDFANMAKMLLSADMTDAMRANMLDMGYTAEQIDNMDAFAAIFAACMQKAIEKGDSYSLESLLRIAGHSTEHERLKLQKQELKNKNTIDNGGAVGVIEIPAISEDILTDQSDNQDSNESVGE